MRNVIFHNPQCSKSRATLQLLRDRKVDIEVVEYLKNPLLIQDLKYVCSGLRVKPIEIVRTKEALLKELGLSADSPLSDEAWFHILSNHPKLIERPIVCFGGKVAIGRPPENVLSIL